MTSATQKVKSVRKWKDKPNKKNRKEDSKRIDHNLEVLKEAASIVEKP